MNGAPDLVLIVRPDNELSPLLDRAGQTGLQSTIIVRDATGNLDAVARRLARIDPSNIPENVRISGNGVTVEPFDLHLPVRMIGRTSISAGAPSATSASVHDMSEADRAARGGVSWLLLSPFAATPSKQGAVWLGTERFRRIVESIDRPVVALGGIDSRSTAESALRAGAAGLAGLRLAEIGTKRGEERLSTVVSVLESEVQRRVRLSTERYRGADAECTSYFQ